MEAQQWNFSRLKVDIFSLLFFRFPLSRFLAKLAWSISRSHKVSNDIGRFSVVLSQTLDWLAYQASIYTLSLCRGHSWRVRLAKQETLTPSGHLVSPLVCRGPWMFTVVLYCWCNSDSASALLYFTLKTSGQYLGQYAGYYHAKVVVEVFTIGLLISVN